MRPFSLKYWFLPLLLAALSPRAVGQVVGHTYDPLTGESMSFSLVTFSGRVLDSLTREPLPGAVLSVVAVNANLKNETAVRNYVTDKKGKFTFSAHGGRDNRMEISFLGYKIRTVWLGADQPDVDLGEITMAPSAHEIDRVVVKARMQLYKMKGDTTIYFPKAIKTMEGDKALEILRNMPGVSVTDNGLVSIQGKAVSRTYVNSRLLFGEDPSTALKQLDAAEVASIEAYDEVDEEEARKHGEHARKRKVLNVITFEKFSRSISANARAEAGCDFEKNTEGNLPARYAFIADAGYYSDATQATIKGDVKNIHKNMSEQPISGDSRTGRVEASLHTQVRKSSYSVRYSYNNSIEQSRNINDFTYFPTESFTLKRSSDTTRFEQMSEFHSFSAGYVFKGKEWNVYTTMDGQFNSNGKTEQRTGRTEQEQALLLASVQNYNATGSKAGFNGAVLTSRTFKNRSSVSFNITYDQRDDRVTDLRREVQTTTAGLQLSDLRISSLQPSRNLNVSTSYSPSFPGIGSFFFSLAANVGESKEQQLYIDTQTGLLQAALSTDATDRLTKWMIMTSYSFRREDHTLRFKLDYTMAPRRYDNRLFGTSERSLYHLVEGQAFYSYIANKGNFTVQLENRSIPPQGRMLSSRIDDNNRLFLSAGNPNLKVSTNYSLVFNGTIVPGSEGSLNLQLFSTLTTAPIIQKITYFNTNTPLEQYDNYLALAGSTLSTPVNGSYAFSLSPKLSYQRRIAPLACFIKFAVDYSYRNLEEDTATGFGRADNHAGAFTISLTSNFSSKIRIILANKTEGGWYRSATGYRDKSLRQQLNTTIRWDLLKRCTFTGAYRFEVNRFQSTIANSNNHILNLSFGCRMLDRKATLSINAYDILNQNTHFEKLQTTQGISYAWQQMYGSYFMLSFEYKFNDRK